MGEESVHVSHIPELESALFIPPMVMPEAFGVAPPSLSSAPFAAPDAEGFAGEERKKRGD